MIIDYTDLQPGDEAPDDNAPQAAAKPASANVIVLSADPTLIELTRDSLTGSHRVWRADDVSHAADLMVAAGNAVFLIDSSLADHNTKDLVNQVHEQFPDLAIIVAGRRDDEGVLAPLVSEGTIFRFLHKPASAERIRNFVDATQRRGNAAHAAHAKPSHVPAKVNLAPAKVNHAAQAPVAPRLTASTGLTGTYPTIEHPKFAPPRIGFKLDPAAVRRWSRRSLLFVPVVLVAWALVTWKPWERISSPTVSASPPVAVTPPGEDAQTLKLVEAAELALAEGRLVEPEGRNALELYRAALARDPFNAQAERGIGLVADELLVRAESALMAQDVAGLASAVDAVRAARPDDPRLELLNQDLERMRSSRTADLKSEPTTAERVQGFVQLASDRMRSNRLTGGQDSALGYLMSARKLDPNGAGVKEGIASLSTQLQTNAQRAIRENRLDDAAGILQNAVILDVNRSEVASLRADLEAARISNERADRARLLVLANQRIAQGRLVEPAGDSARHYVDILRAADPAFDGLAETTALLASQALDEARTHAAGGNFERAESLLKTATEAGASATEVTAAASLIATAKAAKAVPPPPSVVPEKSMRRTRFVAPQYPPRALEKGTQGWVDVEFTVGTDGTTRDVSVRGAEPAGVFDRAAIAAVERWRYEPKIVDGTVIDQRVSARLRFELAE